MRAHPAADEAERQVKVSLGQPKESAVRTPTHIRAATDGNSASEAGVTERSMT